MAVLSPGQTSTPPWVAHRFTHFKHKCPRVEISVSANRILNLQQRAEMGRPAGASGRDWR
jgi:hypothetical protein